MRYAQFVWLWLCGIAIVFLIIADNPPQITLTVAAVVIGVFLLDRRMTLRKKEKQHKLIDDAFARWQPSAPSGTPRRLAGDLTSW